MLIECDYLQVLCWHFICHLFISWDVHWSRFRLSMLLRVSLEILNLQPSCPKFSSLTTASLAPWRMRSQEEWCYVYHTDSDLSRVWYHVALCQPLMLPASPLWWLDPWRCSTYYILALVKKKKQEWELCYFNGMASLCSCPWQMLPIPVGDMLHCINGLWARLITYVGHNSFGHVLSTFLCNER